MDRVDTLEGLPNSICDRQTVKFIAGQVGWKTILNWVKYAIAQGVVKERQSDCLPVLGPANIAGQFNNGCEILWALEKLLATAGPSLRSAAWLLASLGKSFLLPHAQSCPANALLDQCSAGEHIMMVFLYGLQMHTRKVVHDWYIST